MLEILKIVHFLSFSAAIGAGLANLVAGARLMPLPAEAMPRAAKYRMVLGMMSAGGLALLWVTGIWLAASSHGAEILTNPAFLAKMAAVLVLTGFSVAAQLAVLRARRLEAAPDPQVMKRLGMGAQVFAVLAVVCAVLAFG